MADKYVPYPLPPCPEEPDPPAPLPCPDWSVCLPFGRKLYSKDGCIYTDGGNPPADGVYGKIIVVDGCIVGAEPLEACLENIAPCAGEPAPCSGVSGGGCCEPSKSSGNLYALDITGAPLVRCNINGGSGISISGDGTVNNPFIISAKAIEVSRVYLTSANDAIAVSGAGAYASPYVLTHKTGKSGKFNGMTFDEYGHLIDTGAGSANSGVGAVVGSAGVTATTDNQTGMVTVGLEKPLRDRNGTYHIGGFVVELDQYNRIFDIQREVTIPEGTYPFGAYDVSVSPTGSITDIAQRAGGLGSAFVMHWVQRPDITSREVTIDLPFATALGGLFNSAGDKDFLQALKLTIDGVEANIDTRTALVPGTWQPFWCRAIFGVGQHTLVLSSPTPWEDSCVTMLIFAIGPIDRTGQS